MWWTGAPCFARECGEKHRSDCGNDTRVRLRGRLPLSEGISFGFTFALVCSDVRRAFACYSMPVIGQKLKMRNDRQDTYWRIINNMHLSVSKFGFAHAFVHFAWMSCFGHQSRLGVSSSSRLVAHPIQVAELQAERLPRCALCLIVRSAVEDN